MSNSRKGGNRERELVDLFWKEGFGSIRVPASGSSTKRPLPDIIAGNGNMYIAIEAKSSSNDVIYIKGGEIEALLEFSQRFDAYARIGIRFDREEWRFFHPDDLYTTKKGNYRIKKEKAIKNGEDFRELIGHSTQKKLK